MRLACLRLGHMWLTVGPLGPSGGTALQSAVADILAVDHPDQEAPPPAEGSDDQEEPSGAEPSMNRRAAMDVAGRDQGHSLGM
jgi:hypothetical protein